MENAFPVFRFKLGIVGELVGRPGYLAIGGIFMSQGYCSPYPLIAVKGTLLCCHLKGNYLFPLGGGGETIVLWKRRKNVVEEEHGKCNGGEERGGGGKKNHGRRGGSLVEAKLTYAQTSYIELMSRKSLFYS